MSDVQIAVIDQQDTQIVLAVPGVQGATGSSIPSGGTADQVLRKNSSTNYDANWTQVTSAMIADGTIVNADVNASAAIAGTKISPDFGGQTVTTTGQVNAARVNVTVNTAPTNGIYLPASNTVGISTNGTGRVFVDASGRVGIGVSTPDVELHVEDATGNAVVQIESSTTGFSAVFFGDTTDGDVGTIRYDHSDNSMRFITDTAERLRITSAGLVGIGTSSPAAILSSKPSASSTTAATTFTGDGLFIDCANTTDGNGNYGGAISWSRSGSSTTRTAAITNVQTGSDSDVQGLAFLTHSSGTSTNPLIEAMRITGAGLVGIGTTSPTSPFTVRTPNGNEAQAEFSGANAGRGLKLSTGAATLADALVIYDAQTSTGEHQFKVNGSDALRITSAGLVGIGTSSPGALLSLAGSSAYTVGNSGRATQGLDVTASAGGAGLFGGAISFGVGGTGRASISAVQGTTDNDSVGLTFNIHNSGTAAADAVEAMRIDGSSGRVGIGTTSPGAKLEVNGGEIYNVNGAITQYLSSGGGAAVIGTFSNTDWAVRTNNVERCRVDTSGRLLVGTNAARTLASYGSAGLQVESTAFATASISAVNNQNTADGVALMLGKSRGAAVGSFTVVQSGDQIGGVYFQGADGAAMRNGASVVAVVDGTPGADDMPGRLVFSTTADGASSPTERMRIRNNGDLWIHSSGGDPQFLITNTVSAGTATRLISGRYSGGTIGTGTESFRVYTNGDVQNTNGIYTTITSDERFKQDIVELGSQWDDIKGINLKKFRYKNDPTGELQLGVIAQELQQVCPGLVTTRTATEEDVDASGGLVVEGDEVYGWKMSILPLKAVKALQEAMKRIETLEAKVAALESA